ncbi:unnamed protein product [Didymodactylos carnosus]|uniref:BZIP domain-containing protein n=1 Tax=Didymodactylos carnosus TaxID=1234261 RepID=A0A813VZ79_9BILA|nr:unnamed protein product [Didymodactylos carnosus]CAF0904320.1 unnamed protein product [Didymodactylos carnosus]CAF3634984.1 unnamed protein product [Didymodactylos carnosus]CAF3684470.1 unnamed protein product [Didymodactylos carnosus]
MKTSMQRRTVPRTDPRYGQLRTRNNVSVKKSREKSRKEHDETVQHIDALQGENEELMRKVQSLKQEYEQLQALFKEHTGIAINELLNEQTQTGTSCSENTLHPQVLNSTKSTLESTPTTNNVMHDTFEIKPGKVEDQQPLLSINIDQPIIQQADHPSPSITAPDFDGAILMINGVQYKIVNINQK